SVAILFPALALAAWEFGDPRRRAWAAGGLIGIGAAIKTFPILMVLALLPSARSRREGIQVAAAAILVPLVAMIPWLAFDGPGKWAVVRYGGIPGLGSLTLLVDPGAAATALKASSGGYSHLALAIYGQARLIVGASMLALGAFL